MRFFTALVAIAICSVAFAQQLTIPSTVVVNGYTYVLVGGQSGPAAQSAPAPVATAGTCGASMGFAYAAQQSTTCGTSGTAYGERSRGVFHSRSRGGFFGRRGSVGGCGG